MPFSRLCPFANEGAARRFPAAAGDSFTASV
jgi:hypothetical protein